MNKVFFLFRLLFVLSQTNDVFQLFINVHTLIYTLMYNIQPHFKLTFLVIKFNHFSYIFNLPFCVFSLVFIYLYINRLKSSTNFIIYILYTLFFHHCCPLIILCANYVMYFENCIII